MQTKLTILLLISTFLLQTHTHAEPLEKLHSIPYMLYLDNAKDESSQSTIHYVNLFATLQKPSKSNQWLSQNNQIKLIPDLNTDKILLGYKPKSGWGISEGHFLLSELNPNTEDITYDGKTYKCLKSKTYIGLWNYKDDIERLTDVYIITDNSWPYKDQEIGVLGLSPSSPFLTWYTKNYETSSDSAIISFHYQMHDLLNDDIRRLRTGNYIREYASTITFNGMYGSQKDIFNSFSYTLDSSIPTHQNWIWNGVSLTAPGFVSSNGNFGEQVCFVNNYNDLLYQENPEVVVSAIKKEVCGFNEHNCKGSTADLSKMTPIEVKFNKESDHTVSFQGDKVITFDPNDGLADISIGDLKTLKDNGVCSDSTTIALGKRFMRFVEVSFEIDSQSHSATILLANYEYPEIGAGVWVLLGVGISVSVILIVLTSYCMIKSCLRRGKKHVSYYYIEVDEPID